MADSFEGLEEVLANLSREVAGIKHRSFDGMLEAGLKVEARSNELAPREHGDLVASSYTRKNIDGSLGVEVGYTAEHAAYVHENLEQKLKGQPRPSGLGKYWGPSGEPKFLENTLARNKKLIVQIIQEKASIK